jgi:N-acyl-D-amino-acid deacylase
MTGMPAEQLGLADRGLLKTGLAADVVVFDARTVIDKATFQSPHQYPEGIEVVVVNGRVVILAGNHTEARPGRVLAPQRS